jgi:hypothetical protein
VTASPTQNPRHSTQGAGDEPETDARKNFTANLHKIVLLHKHNLLRARDLSRAVKALGRVEIDLTSEKGRKHLERAMTRTNEVIHTYVQVVTISYEWLSVMLMTFFEAYLEEGLMGIVEKNPAVLKEADRIEGKKLFDTDSIEQLRTEVRREWARQVLRGGGPETWSKRLRALGARGYDDANVRGAQHLFETRNLIIHTQGIANPTYRQRYTNQRFDGDRVKILSDQFMSWVKAVAGFIKPIDTFLLNYAVSKKS